MALSTPVPFYNDLTFDITLTPASQVVKGPEKTKLKYKLKNLVLEYEMIRSETLAAEAERVYSSSKELAYDHMLRAEVVKFKKRHRHFDQHQSQRPKKVTKSHPLNVRGAV